MVVSELVFVVGDVRELCPFLVALVVSVLQLQMCFGLQAIISVTNHNNKSTNTSEYLVSEPVRHVVNLDRRDQIRSQCRSRSVT